MKNFFVIGGTGFLGSRIISLLASNFPKANIFVLTRNKRFLNTPVRPNVKYIIGNLFDQKSFINNLDNTTDIIYTYGILMENSKHKSILSSTNSTHNVSQIIPTYEDAHIKGVELILKYVKKNNILINSFTYISSKFSPAFVDPKYLATKIEGESLLFNDLNDFNSYIFRPSFMYDIYSLRHFIALNINLIDILASFLQKIPIFGKIAPNQINPLPVDLVAKAIVYNLIESHKGKFKFEIDDIKLKYNHYNSFYISNNI